MSDRPTPPDAQVGLPSEEEIAALIYAEDDWNDFGDRAARAILDLIRPAFEERELLDQRINRQRLRIAQLERKDADWKRHCDAAEANLAQAMEDEREACAVIAETATERLMDSTFDGVARAIRARGETK